MNNQRIERRYSWHTFSCLKCILSNLCLSRGGFLSLSCVPFGLPSWINLKFYIDSRYMSTSWWTRKDLINRTPIQWFPSLCANILLKIIAENRMRILVVLVGIKRALFSWIIKWCVQLASKDCHFSYSKFGIRFSYIAKSWIIFDLNGWWSVLPQHSWFTIFSRAPSLILRLLTNFFFSNKLYIEISPEPSKKIGHVIENWH